MAAAAGDIPPRKSSPALTYIRHLICVLLRRRRPSSMAIRGAGRGASHADAFVADYAGGAVDAHGCYIDIAISGAR